jgi:hypothetical protein
MATARRATAPSPARCTSAIADTLYGRYWGCSREYDCLHFEACYYQGIDYCIREGLKRFDPGAQGEHKIQRGFEPTTTLSCHWVAQPELSDHAIGDFTPGRADARGAVPGGGLHAAALQGGKSYRHPSALHSRRAEYQPGSAALPAQQPVVRRHGEVFKQPVTGGPRQVIQPLEVADAAGGIAGFQPLVEARVGFGGVGAGVLEGPVNDQQRLPGAPAPRRPRTAP